MIDKVVDAKGPQYENITLSNTLISGDFAGRQRTDLSKYEYRFAEPFFHTNLSVTALDDTGTKIPISVNIRPNTDGHTRTLPQYMHEKIVYDSDDPGFGNIVSEDVYPVQYSESGEDDLDVKLRRISSKFEVYNNSTQNVVGSDIFSLSSLYLGNSGNARLEVPLDIGLGSLSPVSVEVTINDMTQNYEYDYVDFGRDIIIHANLAQDNTLEVARHHGSVTVTTAQDFGEIEHLYVNGSVTETECFMSCVIIAPDNLPLEIIAVNYWGGQAHAFVPSMVFEESVSRVPVSNIVPLMLFALVSIPLYWLYGRIKGKQ